MGKWLHGTAVLSRRSVGLLLPLLEGLFPSKQSNLSKGHCLAPTLPMLQSLCAPWDGSHASETSFVFGLCNCWLLGAASSCQAQHIVHNKSRDFRGVGGPTRQRSAMKKGHQALILLPSQLDRTFFFFTKHQIILINKLCNIVI